MNSIVRHCRQKAPAASRKRTTRKASFTPLAVPFCPALPQVASPPAPHIGAPRIHAHHRVLAPMTMDFAEKEIEYIAERLETHQLTYHTVARALALPIAHSKRLLAEYYMINRKTLSASFVATGRRDDAHMVRLFETEADLHDNVALAFDHLLTVHIYSLQLEKNALTDVDVALEELRHPVDLEALPKYRKLGLIEGPELVKAAHTVKPPKGAETAPQAPKPRQQPPKQPAVPEKKPGLVYESRKTAAKSSLLSNYVSRKSENTAKPRAPDEPKKTYQYKSRKLELTEPKERVVVANMDEDGPDEVSTKSVKPAAASTDLNSLFFDDDLTDDGDAAAALKQDAEDESQPIVADEETETEPRPVIAPTVPEDSILRVFTSAASENELANAPPPAPPQETTVDEDGYFTLYKQAEPESRPAKKARVTPSAVTTTKTSKNARGDDKKKQASLMSFFGNR